MDRMAESSSIAVYEDALRMILIASKSYSEAENANFQNLVKKAQEKDIIDDPEEAKTQITKGDLADMLVRTFDLPTGFMYMITGWGKICI